VIDGSTRVFALLGDPVAHTLSPAMQNAAIERLELPYRYRAIRVKPGELPAFLRGKATQLEGFNVTVPHKEAIAPLLDRLAYEAELIGAVNTVLRREGKWLGFNTDGAGYLMSLQADAKFSVRAKRVLLLGAGGSARGIAVALLLAKARQVIIANRTLARAEGLVHDLGFRLGKDKLSALPLEGKDFEKALSRADLLINTTRVGLGGSSFSDFPWKKLKKGALVSDIVYIPRLTPFLKAAKKWKHPIHTGEGMLIFQGALALEIWTGAKPDPKLMRRAILKKLS
jgi:shikimate dehydrogenase